ncbi:MAG: PAS domain-containing protein [Gammaproteobacteria bacterium]|nr:PAS domain-containing protein [Gammaproteobacteria bacterium]
MTRGGSPDFLTLRAADAGVPIVEALTRELDALRGALDAHAIVSVTDAHGRIIAVNDHFCAISGYSRDELVGANHRILKSGAHPPAFYRTLWRTIAGGAAWHGVIENRAKDGDAYWVQSSILPLRDAAGVTTGYLSLRTDVSAIERQRRALRIMTRNAQRPQRFDIIAEALGFARHARTAAVLAFPVATTRVEVVGYWHADGRAAPGDFERAGTTAGFNPRTTLTVQGDALDACGEDPLLDASVRSVELTPLVNDEGRMLGVLWVGGPHLPDAGHDDLPLTELAARRAASHLQNDLAQRERDEQRAWLEFVIDGAKAGIWDWELDSGKVRINPRWAEMLGYAPGEIAPELESWDKLIHPDDRAMVWRKIEAHLAGETAYYESEHRLRSAFDSWIWVLDRGMVTARDAIGEARRMSGMHLDITSQKQAQSALAAEQERLDIVMQTTPIGLWEWDITTDVMTSSPQWLARLGYRSNDRPTTVDGWRALIHPEDIDRVLAVKEAHLADATVPYLAEFRIRTAAGEWRWVLSRASVTARDEHGQPTRLSGVHVDVHDQHVTAEHLREERHRLEHISAVAGLGLWEWEIAPDRFVVNAELARLLGYDVDHFAHVADWTALLHPDEHDAIMAVVEQHLAGHSDYIEMEARARHADGGWLWMLSRSYVAERDAEGNALRMVGVQIDIHERKLADEALAESKARLELVLRGADVGLYEWDVSSGGHHVDERWANMLGYEVDELEPDISTWRKLVHPHDLPAIDGELEALLRGDTDTYMHETRLRTKDGNWAWVLDRGAIMTRDADGRALTGAGIHIDITERKRAEAALSESEARLRALIEYSPVGVCMSDLNGHITYANPVVRALLGQPVPGSFDRAWARSIHPADRAAALGAWERYIEAGETEFDHEYRIVRHSGEVLTVHVRAAPVRSAGEVLGHVGIFEDMTAQRAFEEENERMRRQVQQAQKMEAIGQLTGGIAHDFNNILGSVLGFGSLALRRYGAEATPKLVEYLEAIVAAGERGRDLVGKMLAFSRGTPSEDVKPIDPGSVVREASGMLAAVIPSNITYRLQAIPADLPAVLIDSVELHQVLVNLVVNARDAVGERGAIRVQLEVRAVDGAECAACHQPVSGRFVEITVSDDGCGIDDDDLGRLFEPFYTTKEVGKGTGMGLAVVHGVLHRAHGHILVETRPGVGTTFRVLLPAVAGDEVAETVAVPTQAAQLRPGLRILVVDDDAPMLGLLRELLGEFGAHLTTLADGRAAERAFIATPDAFDVLLTDQTTPGLGGHQLVEAVRRCRPGFPAVVISGNLHGPGIESLRRDGIPVLAKPLDEQALIAALDAVTALGAND